MQNCLDHVLQNCKSTWNHDVQLGAHSSVLCDLVGVEAGTLIKL